MTIAYRVYAFNSMPIAFYKCGDSLFIDQIINSRTWFIESIDFIDAIYSSQTHTHTYPCQVYNKMASFFLQFYTNQLFYACVCMTCYYWNFIWSVIYTVRFVVLLRIYSHFAFSIKCKQINTNKTMANVNIYSGQPNPKIYHFLIKTNYDYVIYIESIG